MNNFEYIRENGIGNGFTVSDPHDGFRKDNRLWFGTCETCGQSVVNNVYDKFWAHTVSVGENATREIDYCPKA